MAAYTEAKKASNQKWDAANLDRLSLAIPKGQKEAIKDHTTAQGESVNGFIWRAIQEAMERDKAKEGQQRPQEGPEEAQAAAQESPSAAPAQEEATKPPCPLPYLWDGADMEQIASNCLSALDDIGYTVGEIADLLLTLSLLAHGNEYHPRRRRDHRRDNLGRVLFSFMGNGRRSQNGHKRTRHPGPGSHDTGAGKEAGPQ